MERHGWSQVRLRIAQVRLRIAQVACALKVNGQPLATGSCSSWTCGVLNRVQPFRAKRAPGRCRGFLRWGIWAWPRAYPARGSLSYYAGRENTMLIALLWWRRHLCPVAEQP